jgi:hypothetical protein
MKNFLLPYPFKLVGLFVTFIGLIFAVFYIWFDFRFTMPVFAVFSSFMETKIFATFKTNFADELTMLLLISGLALLVFSKERVESDDLNLARQKALTKASIANTIFLFLSTLFIYGSGFIGILVFNLFSFSLFYLVFFYIAKRMVVKE